MPHLLDGFLCGGRFRSRLFGGGSDFLQQTVQIIIFGARFGRLVSSRFVLGDGRLLLGCDSRFVLGDGRFVR